MWISKKEFNKLNERLAELEETCSKQGNRIEELGNDSYDFDELPPLALRLGISPKKIPIIKPLRKKVDLLLETLGYEYVKEQTAPARLEKKERIESINLVHSILWNPREEAPPENTGSKSRKTKRVRK